MRKTVFLPSVVWYLMAFLLPLAIHLSTLAPSVTFYDSGEFITAIHFLGSAHSPGYPLFLLFAKPFTWLPCGSIAFRVNLATAVSAALACAAVFQLLKCLLSDLRFSSDNKYSLLAINSASLAGSLLFATSPRLWLQTNHDKPYPLMSLLVAFIFIFLVKWKKELDTEYETPAWIYGAAFLGGVATGAHQTIILFAPAMLLFVLLSRRCRLADIKELFIAVMLSISGAFVQIYLPVRAAAMPNQNWGDPSTFSRFIWHFLRKGYPEEQHGRDLYLLLKQLAAFSVPHEYGWLGLFLFLAGILILWRRNRPFVAALGVALLCYWGVIALFFNPQPDSIFLTEEFYTPLYLFSSVMIVVALYSVVSAGVSAAEEPEDYGRIHAVMLVVFFMLLPAFQFVLNYGSNDQHRNYVAQDYAVNSLRSLPEDAVLFTWGDSGAFPLWYVQGVERLREDLDLPHIPHLPFVWYRFELPRMKPFLNSSPSALQAEKIFTQTSGRILGLRPVCIDYSTRYSISSENLSVMQHGFLFLIADREFIRQYDAGKNWDYLAIHRSGFSADWQLDGDTEKALMIVAHSLFQSADAACSAKEKTRCAHFLKELDSMVPSWKTTTDKMRLRYGIN